MKSSQTLELEQEWIELIKEAKELGISKEDIRSFISDNDLRTGKTIPCQHNKSDKTVCTTF